MSKERLLEYIRVRKGQARNLKLTIEKLAKTMPEGVVREMLNGKDYWLACGEYEAWGEMEIYVKHDGNIGGPDVTFELCEPDPIFNRLKK